WRRQPAYRSNERALHFHAVNSYFRKGIGMKRLNSHLRAPRAFTLIELLVVIAIIAILAAILFPVFAQAREKARAISCVSNEKQLALGVLMYIQDFDEMFPLYFYRVAGQPADPPFSPEVSEAIAGWNEVI